jgi:hypothetical protein
MSGLLTTAFLTLVVSINAIAYPSGSPAGYTGSPGDGQHCVSCHNGSAATVTGWITSNIPATGYIAGTIYNMSVTVSGSGKKGFEVSPQNATGTQLGILTAGTGNHLVGGTKYVTQNSSGSTSSTVTWNFTWTAPVAGTGTVTFYGAFTVGKSNTKLSTMVVSEDASVPLSATASATPTVICAGQTSQLDVSPAGGSGTYSYSWTSIPAGFTSLLKNPVVSPTITTQYIVHVSDGAFAVDAPANVTVNQPATAVAGNDTTFPFITTQVPLMGMAANYSTVLWTTSGSGTFSDANALSGNYLPSTADKTGGNVTLTLTASAQSPCTTAVVDTRNIHFDSPTGIDGVTNTALDLVLSPNPSTGLFSLRTHGFEPGSALVTISDLQGKIIVQKKMDATDNLPVQFNLSGTPAGLYLVKIQTSRVMLIRKLVIE